MQPEIIQSMHEQVRAIYRAFTGEDVGEGAVEGDGVANDETIARQFAELDAIARTFPSVVARVPPFTFVPPVDVIATDDAVLVELALPGVDRDEITIERAADALTISGIRRDGHAGRGDLFHAEIPRGPFLRTIPLPFPVDAEPRIELEDGVLRIYLTLAASTRRAGPGGSSEQEREKRGEQPHDNEDGEQRRAAP